MYYQKAFIELGLVAQAKSESNICVINDKRQIDKKVQTLLTF